MGATYITFTDPTVLKVFNEDIKLFSRRFLSSLNITEEVQYGGDVGRKTKYLVDVEGKKFLLTGSSARAISSEVLSFLVGRATVVELCPFSLKEAATARGGTADLLPSEWKRIVNESLVHGLFPEVVLSSDPGGATPISGGLLLTMSGGLSRLWSRPSSW